MYSKHLIIFVLLIMTQTFFIFSGYPRELDPWEKEFIDSLPTVYDLYKDGKTILIGETDGIIAKLVAKRFPAIIIENKGNFPVKLNHTSDEYYYINQDDKYFLIVASDGNKPYFPSGTRVLNPDDAVGITFSTDDIDEFNKFTRKLRQGNVIGMLVVINHGKTKITLRPSD